MNTSEIKQWAVEKITSRYDAGEASSIVQIVLEDEFSISRHAKERAWTHSEMARLEVIILRLEEGEPVQYILGEADFFGLKFKVNPSVLIPRQETEELVARGLQWLKQAPAPTPSVLDIGTGSGCIAITLKKKMARAQVWAIDISPEALNIAQDNAQRNQTEIKFLNINILEHITQSEDLPNTFDLIVSNPPYIPRAEAAIMPEHVTEWEPHLALFVADERPYIFHETIADFAQEHLVQGGKLLFEINEFRAAEVADILTKQGFQEVQTLRDLSGAWRIVEGLKRVTG
jgi:release factor glutamine methyltransferase